MKLSAEILKRIEYMGADGYSLARIARELNMSPAELRDERANNEKLNEALERAEYCYDQYLIGKYEEKSLSIKSPVQLELLKQLKQKHGSNNDGKLEVEYV